MHTEVGRYLGSTRNAVKDLGCYLELVCNKAVLSRGRGRGIHTRYKYMYRYVGHVASAIEKSDVDQVLSRKRCNTGIYAVVCALRVHRFFLISITQQLLRPWCETREGFAFVLDLCFRSQLR